MIKHILVPYDFSNFGDLAFEKAVEIAKKSDSKIRETNQAEQNNLPSSSIHNQEKPYKKQKYQNLTNQDDSN